MSNLLNEISLPEGIKKLSDKECELLCSEIREFLVDNVSKTGGHLASNLGVVELTVAMYRALDFPKDKVIWDVGHQSYVHKILSGRKDSFSTLRQFGGMSGFPKTCESQFDCFNTGHSSTSISSALGIAKAREISGDAENVIAVFGDGALTGGMMYEALNHIGHTKTKLILVLNDNAMSISKNVGAVSKYLRNLRAKPEYFKSKKRVEKALSRMPLCGGALARFLRQIKRGMRNLVLPPSMFEDLGIKYIGPIDGHNINALSDALEVAKESKKPILLHIKTKKGKGFLPAEQYPQYFHGISKFDIEQTEYKRPENDDYSANFGKELLKIAEENKKVVAITAAMPIGTGLDIFAEKLRSRFFDVGIAEQHGVTFAAGMAISGFVPVVAVYSSFAQRAYDQILHDVCLQKLHVVFCIDRAGVVGADGETHHGLYDIAYLSHMPNMTILSPSSFVQFKEMLNYAINVHTGPVAIRYPRGNDQYLSTEAFEYGKVYLKEEGNNVTIVASGRMMITADKVCRQLREDGKSADLIELPTIMDFNVDVIKKSVLKTGLLAVIEDHTKVGGLANIVTQRLVEENVLVNTISFAYPNAPVTHGTVAELDKFYGLDSDSILSKIKEKINE